MTSEPKPLLLLPEGTARARRLRPVQAAPDREPVMGDEAPDGETEEMPAFLSREYGMILDAVGDGVLGLDREGTAVFVNPAAAQMLGYAREELIGRQSYSLLLEDRPGDALFPWEKRSIYRTLHDGQTHRAADEVFRRKDGSSFPVEYISSALRLGERIVGAVCTFRDITERKDVEAALAHQATHDPLTDLPNRALLIERIHAALEGKEHQECALLLLDLDGFKEINDVLGHHLGDLLLQQIARRIQQTVRSSDTVARLGGDEFGILLPGTGAQGARSMAARLLAAMDQPFSVEGQFLGVGASVGIALAPDHSTNAQTLLRQADVATYVAKRSNAGCTVYTPEQDRHSARRLSLVGGLRRAIDNGGLLLHYQPKATLATGSISGVEALVRWQHPTYGLVPPDHFIPQAERSGLIKPLTAFVLDSALRQCHDWGKRGHALGVAVNLSMWNLQDPQLPETIEQCLRDHSVPPELLAVELTESTVMGDVARSTRALQSLSDLGIRVAIDDFGTGYSSLSYLKRLRVHEIKIDKSFIRHMATDDADLAIVAATIGLGHSLGLSVVAEGVEDQALWDLLDALGCDTVQGYHLSRPLPADALLDWLRTRGTDPAQP